MAQQRKEDDNVKAKLKKKLKKQTAVALRELLTPGNILRPSDFREAIERMQKVTEDLRSERAEDQASVPAIIAETRKIHDELEKELKRLEKVREDLTAYGMNRSHSNPY